MLQKICFVLPNACSTLLLSSNVYANTGVQSVCL
ncbi:hypothetical protein SSP1_155 [Shigella phage SSP1]|uniref:Uncharacterized protein n=1 Tax=Shigella phage SSP1 TaxID=1983588 RepID=A0A2K8GQ60_9CAUD|nr:hypothetical protein HOS34_gp027 [Shigella phage SSP1]ASD50326.1 hypothetical protein SSP1_155 [Shigella phage SSP1]